MAILKKKRIMGCLLYMEKSKIELQRDMGLPCQLYEVVNFIILAGTKETSKILALLIYPIKNQIIGVGQMFY